MHLAAVLELLTAHSALSLEPHEAAMVQATSEFVRSNPDALLRSNLGGHLTGSAWIVDRAHIWTLLTHHRKLDKWLQLGGHADGDPDLLAVALREAEEESGLGCDPRIEGPSLDRDRQSGRTQPGRIHGPDGQKDAWLSFRGRDVVGLDGAWCSPWAPVKMSRFRSR